MYTVPAVCSLIVLSKYKAKELLPFQSIKMHFLTFSGEYQMSISSSFVRHFQSVLSIKGPCISTTSKLLCKETLMHIVIPLIYLFIWIVMASRDGPPMDLLFFLSIITIRFTPTQCTSSTLFSDKESHKIHIANLFL